MDLQDLRVLLVVMERGSIAEAARSLGMSRTAVADRLERLEHSVGAPVVVRGMRGTKPTEAGKELARGARPLLRDADTLLQQVRQGTGAAGGLIRIVLQFGAPPKLVAQVAQGLVAANPQLRLQLDTSHAPLTQADDADVLVVFGDAPPQGPYRTFVIDNVPVRLFASPEYLDRHGCIETLQDLARHPLAVWSLADPPAEGVPLLAGGQWPVRPTYVTDDAMLLRALAEAGTAVCLGLDSDVYRLVADDGMVRVLDDVVGTSVAARVLICERSAASARTRLALQAWREWLEELQAGRGAAPPS